MANIQISLTCADYARVMPLATGDVKPEGIDLTLVHGTEGSWPMRAEMLRRALQDTTVQGGEASMAQHLYRLDRGDKSFIALPAFVLRNFTSRDIYVRKGSPLKGPNDLAGKRMGTYSWTASGSIWYRHFLRYLEVDPKSLEYCVGDVDAPSAGARDPALPEAVRTVPKGRSTSDLLLDGEVDFLYSPARPKRFDATNGPIVRLFSDVRSVDRDYFRRTGVFPPHHLIVLRREVWERDPSIARRLNDAFLRCNDAFHTAQRSFPYASPWLDSELEEARALMGEDSHPYGIEKNRKTVEAFCDQALQAGLVKRRIGVDEYFAEFLTS